MIMQHRYNLIGAHVEHGVLGDEASLAGAPGALRPKLRVRRLVVDLRVVAGTSGFRVGGVLELRFLDEGVALNGILGRAAGLGLLVGLYHVALVGIGTAALFALDWRRREVLELVLGTATLEYHLRVQRVSARLLRIPPVLVERSASVVVRSRVIELRASGTTKALPGVSSRPHVTVVRHASVDKSNDLRFEWSLRSFCSRSIWARSVTRIALIQTYRGISYRFGRIVRNFFFFGKTIRSVR